MKGDVEILTKLVDSYIASLEDAVTQLKIEGMARGTLSILRKAKLEELTNRLRYVKYERDRALFLDADYADTEKAITIK